MPRLPLGDSRWRDLAFRTCGDADDPDIPAELAQLLSDPQDLERFHDLWPYLCSEGTTWEAAYAAVPWIVEIARHLPPDQRPEYLVFVGLAARCECPDRGAGFVVRDYLADEYKRAKAEALSLLAATLLREHDAGETRYLLAAAAALKGYRELGDVIESLDCGTICPACGTDIDLLET